MADVDDFLRDPLSELILNGFSRCSCLIGAVFGLTRISFVGVDLSCVPKNSEPEVPRWVTFSSAGGYLHAGIIVNHAGGFFTLPPLRRQVQELQLIKMAGLLVAGAGTMNVVTQSRAS